MDWLAAVDIYCERPGPGYWAEPVNALSNAAFLLAAAWAWATARVLGSDAAGRVLIGMAALIGIGSFLFHTHATVWAELADMVPIWSFVAAYVFAVVRRTKGRTANPVVVPAFGLAVGSALVALTFDMPADAPLEPAARDPFNGSLQYLPALIAQGVFAAVLIRQRHPHRVWVIAALGSFVLSLAFRTLDRDICATLPVGTHFLWHLLNGLMVGLLLQFYLRLGSPVTGR